MSTTGYNSTTPIEAGQQEPAPTLQIQGSGGQWQIVFQGALQETAALTGTWSEVTGATSPHAIATTETKRFYRAVGR